MAEDTKSRVREITRILKQRYPDARTALRHETPFQLLIATILAAQSTDVMVNRISGDLFRKYPGPEAFAKADPRKLEQDIRATGFFRQKARSIIEASQDIVNLHGGETPDNMEELVKLRGVGRKTANVVLGNAFGKPAIAVDTHVLRLSGRLGLTDPKNSATKNAVQVEQDLMKLVPEEDWTVFSHLLISLGRETCTARKPKHDICPVLHLCPTGQAAMNQD